MILILWLLTKRCLSGYIHLQVMIMENPGRDQWQDFIIATSLALH